MEKARLSASEKRVLAGNWEHRGSTLTPPFFCRYFFSWAELGKGRIAGYFGGYMGGGVFHDDTFHATFRRGRLIEFVFSSRDWVSDDERQKPWPKDAEAAAEEHFKIFCQWIDFPKLEATGGLWMAPGRIEAAQSSEWNGWEMWPGHLFIAPSGARGDATMRKVAAMARRSGIATSWDVYPDE